MREDYQSEHGEATGISLEKELSQMNARELQITLKDVPLTTFIRIVFSNLPEQELYAAYAQKEYPLMDDEEDHFFERIMEAEKKQNGKYYAMIDCGGKYPVLLVTDHVYDGHEMQVSILCDVYYTVDEKTEKIAEISSDGTAYPIAYDNILTEILHIFTEFALRKRRLPKMNI